MDEAKRLIHYEGSRLFLRPAGSRRDAVALQAAMDGAARQLRVYATMHHLDDIVERELEGRTQLDGEPFFNAAQANGQFVRGVRKIGGAGAFAPPPHRRLTDAELPGQFHHRCPAALDVGSRLGRGRRVGVQSHFHDPRRSSMNAMPRTTPIRSSQSSGTEHLRGDDVCG